MKSIALRVQHRPHLDPAVACPGPIARKLHRGVAVCRFDDSEAAEELLRLDERPSWAMGAAHWLSTAAAVRDPPSAPAKTQ